MSGVCISHKEDVDGICSAAVIKAAFDISKVILVDYGNLISKLEKTAEMLDRIVSAGTEVIYIDHHDISKETLHTLKKADVTLIRTIEECTSMQAYTKYKKKLPEHAAFLAAMGALT